MTQRQGIHQRHATLAVLAAVVLGAALRLPGLETDFWLDEVWTWQLAQQLESALGVFTDLHHSNNHHLNTLFVYALGDGADAALYRLPALLTGVACIPLAAALLWRHDRLAAVLAAAFVAGSFALVHFSSEARGSGPTVAFALAALWLLERDLLRPRWPTCLGFAACLIAGFSFQLVFCFFWAGALAWSGWELWRQQPAATASSDSELWHRQASPAAWLTGMARLHALPALAFFTLYAVDLRHLAVGGGEPLDLAWLVGRIVGYAFGLSTQPALAWPLALFVTGLLIAGLRALATRGDRRWLAIAITLFAAPSVVIAVFRPDVLAVRYFLIGVALAMLLLATLVADALRAGGARRAIAVAGIAVFAIGNLVHTSAFLREGRGGYRAALAQMDEASSGRRIEVGSDHDFRVGSVLAYHARELPEPERFHYTPQPAWPDGGPEWLVMHRQTLDGPPDPFVTAGGATFGQVGLYDHAAISGYTWILYRNAQRRAGPATSR